MWMMPTGNRFGPWPRSGEIDIVEIRSNNDFTCRSKQVGNKLMGSTLHFGIFCNYICFIIVLNCVVLIPGPDSQHNTWRPTHYEAYAYYFIYQVPPVSIYISWHLLVTSQGPGGRRFCFRFSCLRTATSSAVYPFLCRWHSNWRSRSPGRRLLGGGSVRPRPRWNQHLGQWHHHDALRLSGKNMHMFYFYKRNSQLHF